LILGTAQLGLNYGISNKLGQPSLEQASEILELAHSHGVKILDTAFAYGDSEKVVGELNQGRFEIISKLPDLSKLELSEDYNEIHTFLRSTLENTQQQQLHAYLLHSVINLTINGDELWRQMQEFKEHGLIKKIGYSLYSPKQLDIYFDRYKPDIVQIPMNILDREFQKAGWLKKLKDNGVEIHVRSVFLQGLLLMSYEEQILKFPIHKNTWELFRNELKDFGGTAVDYCLGFIKGIEEIDEMVIGANSANELKEIMASDSKINSVPIELSASDPKLIYPFNWN
jgi:aryl-alcohol dehydrogenase-like predicted oxidoreductase